MTTTEATPGGTPGGLPVVQRRSFVDIVTAEGGAFAGHAWRKLTRDVTLAVFDVEPFTTSAGERFLRIDGREIVLHGGWGDRRVVRVNAAGIGTVRPGLSVAERVRNTYSGDVGTVTQTLFDPYQEVFVCGVSFDAGNEGFQWDSRLERIVEHPLPVVPVGARVVIDGTDGGAWSDLACRKPLERPRSIEVTFAGERASRLGPVLMVTGREVDAYGQLVGPRWKGAGIVFVQVPGVKEIQPRA